MPEDRPKKSGDLRADRPLPWHKHVRAGIAAEVADMPDDIDEGSHLPWPSEVGPLALVSYIEASQPSFLRAADAALLAT
jgi:hypothetical protein